ncbi:hypothetical protein [Luteolibacter sp. Populi]|uniref:hypothetical protein n=1 Tax=Luteolibacter sp. Populi TaxID=3230487 RepID=UPI003466F869
MTPQVLEDLLRLKGPSLSSELGQQLVARGLSEEAARQRMSRAKGEVRRLEGFHFPNREKFLFLSGQFKSPSFLANLSEALIKTNSAYGQFLLGLESQGGFLLSSQSSIATGLPIAPTKGHILHESAASKLEEFGLIETFQTGNGEEVIRLKDPADSIDRWRSVKVAEDIALDAVLSWLGKMGFSSPGVTKIRDGETCPSFGQFSWDVVGPSYLSTLTGTSPAGVKNGFFVCDVSLGRTVTLRSLKPFLAKWDSLRWQKRATRFQPMILGKFFEPAALAELRKRGCIVALPKTLFGEDGAAALLELISTVENAAVAVRKNPEAVFEMLRRVAKLEGTARNLSGVVLELLVGHLYHLKGYNIDISKVIYDEQRRPADIDVRARNHAELVFCECKAKGPGTLVNDYEIRHWLDNRVPRMKSWAKLQSEAPRAIRFEFYSTTGFTDDAKSLIEHVKQTHKKQPITFIDGAGIVDELYHFHQSKLIDMFREQFGDSRELNAQAKAS